MNSPLKPLYNACGALAGIAMIALLLLIVANVLGRLLGFYLRGADAYAGYAMAASSFFALAYALGHGDHIRVTLFVQKASGARRRALELWCLGVASCCRGSSPGTASTWCGGPTRLTTYRRPTTRRRYGFHSSRWRSA
jgi:TRAP-type C4-dicarboxylate transport system permease small subunit